jgi:hypothetical protein
LFLFHVAKIPKGAAQGKGRGRQVIAITRTADLILMLLDCSKGLLTLIHFFLPFFFGVFSSSSSADVQRRLLEYELESVV